MKTSLLSRRIRREGRVIASVFPAGLAPLERPFDGATVFTMPPCPKGERPQLLKILDAVQFGRDPLSRDILTESLIEVDDIAKDLVGHWARTPIGAPAGSGPGVGLIAGDTPTDEEIQALYDRQDVMFEYFYQDGLRLAQNQEWRGINGHHRLAAKWLEREEPWAIDTGRQTAALEECPLCGSMIPASKAFCMVCKQQIRELPAEFAAMQPSAPKRKAA